MDWKYKHFQGERVFPAERDVVMEATRAFMTETLEWQVTDTPAGLTAQGSSFSHRAIVNLHIKPAPGGTNVAVELLVQRAGVSGLMLFDVGGYYSIQIRKWLEGIQWSLDQKLTGSHGGTTNPLVLADNKATARIFNGCLMFIVVTFGLYVVVTFGSALVGLLTGHLFLLGGGGSPVIHGPWARILSALILMFGAFLVWRIKRKK